MKPSAIKKKEDLKLVIESMRANKFQPYDEKFNPYSDDEPLRKERFERYYRREQQSFLRVDRDWKDLCEVYGFPYERQSI